MAEKWNTKNIKIKNKKKKFNLEYNKILQISNPFEPPFDF